MTETVNAHQLQKLINSISHRYKFGRMYSDTVHSWPHHLLVCTYKHLMQPLEPARSARTQAIHQRICNDVFDTLYYREADRLFTLLPEIPKLSHDIDRVYNSALTTTQKLLDYDTHNNKIS